MTTTGDRKQEQIISQATALHNNVISSCNGVGYGGVGGSLIIDPDGNILQESGVVLLFKLLLLILKRVTMLREKGLPALLIHGKIFGE